jgi:hypothetical protein
MITVTFDDWSMISPRSASDLAEVLVTGVAREISGGRVQIDVPAGERDVEHIPVEDDLWDDMVGR